MGNLLEEIVQFFDTSKARTDEEKARNAIAVIQGCRDLTTLTALIMVLPGNITALPIVDAAIKSQQSELEKQGDHGIYAPITKALFDGVAELSEPIQDALVQVLRDALVPGSPKVTEAIEGSLEVLVDAVLNPIIPPDRPGAEEARKQIKSTIMPLVRLETTIAGAATLAELIHPMKEMGFGSLSHVFHDSFGFQALTGAAIGPLSRAVVGAPIEKSINKIFQPYLPVQGELTGLARKHEITKDQYREAMRGYGVKEEYIDALLTGFWADPRLFEIVRIIPYARPPGSCPEEAAAWLRKAGLQQYIGENWWLALKFAKAGYDDLDIPVLIDVVNAMYLQKELGDIRTVKKSQYKTGQITREAYTTFLMSRGLHREEINEMLDAIAVETKSEFAAEKQKLYEKKFLNGRMTEADLRTAFALVPLEQEFIDLRVKYLVEQKLGKLREDTDSRALTVSQIIDAFENGTWTKDAAVKRLDDMGWLQADALVILDNAEKKLIADDNAERIRAAEQAAKNLRLSKGELLAVYAAAGKRPGWAAARADYIEQLVMGKESTSEG